MEPYQKFTRGLRKQREWSRDTEDLIEQRTRHNAQERGDEARRGSVEEEDKRSKGREGGTSLKEVEDVAVPRTKRKPAMAGIRKPGKNKTRGEGRSAARGRQNKAGLKGTKRGAARRLHESDANDHKRDPAEGRG